jgi:hypothetical protein
MREERNDLKVKFIIKTEEERKDFENLQPGHMKRIRTYVRENPRVQPSEHLLKRLTWTERNQFLFSKTMGELEALVVHGSKPAWANSL